MWNDSIPACMSLSQAELSVAQERPVHQGLSFCFAFWDSLCCADRPQRSSCLSLPSSWGDSHMPLHWLLKGTFVLWEVLFSHQSCKPRRLWCHLSLVPPCPQPVKQPTLAQTIKWLLIALASLRLVHVTINKPPQWQEHAPFLYSLQGQCWLSSSQMLSAKRNTLFGQV